MARTYPPDEFDRLAESGGPIGVHRAPRTVMGRLAPYLIALLVAGGAAYGVVTYLWSGSPGSDEPEPVLTFEPTAPTPTPTPTPTPSATPTPEPVVVFDTKITVLNAASIAGLAGRQSEVLTAAGFTDVSTGNLTSNLPDVSTVYYADEDLEDTAQAVAEALGLDTVVNAPPPRGGVIEVVLRTDPAA